MKTTAMRTIAITSLILIAASPAMAREPQTQTVPAWRWVNAVTENGETGKVCAIEFGGNVAEIGRHEDRVLVSYSPAYAAFRASSCERGTMFFLPIAEFEGMTARYRERAAASQEEVQVIRSLLKK